MRTASMIGVAALMLAPAAGGQVVVQRNRAALTIEAWGNGVYVAGADSPRLDDEDWQLDGGVRALGLVQLQDRGRIGARAVATGFAGVEDDLELSERSLLWTGALGRIEYGHRQGLPDVLTGYAPNPFTFTTAEFGPASGLSLDPAGSVIQRFVADTAAQSADYLAVLGYSTSLFGDLSRKLLYVSPKRGGWLGAVSYAADPDGAETEGLLQSGLVHETYRGQDVFRAGAAWTRLATTDGDDLDSWYAGASLDLDQVWLLGIGATWNPGDSREPVPGWPSDAVGVTSSVNYNRGPWTLGSFVQYARGREAAGTERERLRAVEAGASYRTSTRLRLFLSWYYYRLDGQDDAPATDDNLLIAGVRITL